MSCLSPGPSAAYYWRVDRTPPLSSVQARSAEIAGMLTAAPVRLAPSRKDRPIWANLAATEPQTSGRIFTLAETYLAEPVPELTDAAYLDARQSGVYDGYAREAEHRRVRLTIFTLAEGLENSGRFLPAINREITAICAERIWVMPPHDWNRVNFEGVRIDIDLISAMTAWALAAADTMLDDGLEKTVRQSIRGRIRQTVTGPFQAAIRGLREPEWWALSLYNWNAVVHAGIIGAALLLDDFSNAERAEMIAAAEPAMRLYLSGFPADGYSPEGVGYWRYGFGHFTLLAEAILVATGGRLSLFASAHARLIATFPERFEMTRGTHFYPPFSDARFPEPFAGWLGYLLDQRYGFGGQAPRVVVPEGDFAHGFFSTFLYAWGVTLSFDPELAPPWLGENGITPARQPHDWFEDSQVLVTRAPAGRRSLSAALKGGHNGVSHGHNDLGTFVVTVGETPVIVDPGLVVYGPLAFGPRRFEHQIQGSYGHPVPLVAGQWQGTGQDFLATVEEQNFNDAVHRITLDLTRAYAVPALRSLQRTFEFCGTGRGTLTVSDRVAFHTPQSFGVALITYGEAHEEAPGVWIVSQDAAQLRVEIEAGDAAFTVTNEVMRDRSRLGDVRRLGVDLLAPTTGVTLRLRITSPDLPPG